MMEDPTGSMLSAEGDYETPGSVVDYVLIKRGPGGQGVMVQIAMKPSEGQPGELSLPVDTEEMNEFGSWKEAQDFVSGMMASDATPEAGPIDPEADLMLEESEPTGELPFAEQMHKMMPPRDDEPVEFAGQRSYGR